MGALDANKETARKDGQIVSVPVKASTHIYKGAFVMTADNAGLLIPCADTASCTFQGVAVEEKNNTGADGAVSCRVYKTGCFKIVTSSAAQESVGAELEASDDQTAVLGAATTNHVKVGIVSEYISATSVYVRIDGYAK